MKTQHELIELARDVGVALYTRNQKLVTAESCTGGGVAQLITEIAGSSDWFDRGYVTYSNQSKTQLLGVEETLLSQHGAVSEPVARAMAEGAIRSMENAVGISVTGIAGPDGGSQTKPVGTVWIAWSNGENSTQCRQFRFDGDRHQIRQQALEQVLLGLLGVLRHNQGPQGL